jgi:hypothetical protein
MFTASELILDRNGLGNLINEEKKVPAFILSHYGKWGSRGGVVGIATGYGLDDRGVGVRVPVG